MTVAVADTHTHTHTLRLLWTRDRPVAETTTWQHEQKTRSHAPMGFQPQPQQAIGLTYTATGIGLLKYLPPML
jgi:hypothetical protein